MCVYLPAAIEPPEPLAYARDGGGAGTDPKNARILANELLGTRLAARLGLRVPEADIVEVRQDLIAHTEDRVDAAGARARALPGREAIRLALSGQAGGNDGVRFSVGRAVARAVQSCGFSGNAGLQ